ncbi:YIPF6 protein [Rhizoctonia solani AG-3 Rhs1AP]|uniref:Protein YIP n=1 Tax=Rhizoctonia solani AG-3 Rhs1AP TaxID=1086054 RepID=X8JNR7_9AGAM|nr:YIPF6 protein [Rhizoctonia solani AG-3 Rhs1AP]
MSASPAPPQHYIVADDDDVNDEDIPGFTQPAIHGGPTSPALGVNAPLEPVVLTPNPALSGNIGSSNGAGGAGHSNNTRQQYAGVRLETRYAGADTLDEPVTATITRDLLSIYSKLLQVLYPRRAGASREVLRDWDLWGPLVLCLALGILLSINAPPTQSLGVFTGVVVIVSIGSLVVTLNAKLLGGRVSLFQSLCVLGYCTFPLVLAAIISTFVRVLYVRAPIALAAWAWCVWAAVNFLDGTKLEQKRILLAVYPLLLFYFLLAWMILVQ